MHKLCAFQIVSGIIIIVGTLEYCTHAQWLDIMMPACPASAPAAQAAPYAPGAMYHPPPSPAPLPASEFDDPQGIMKGRMRSHAASEGAAAGALLACAWLPPSLDDEQ